MRIVIDTNIIFRDFNLSGTNFKLLLDTARKMGYSVFFPDVVVDEVVSKYQDELKSSRNKIEKELSNVKRLIQQENIALSVLDEINFVNEHVSKFKSFLKKQIGENEIKTIPYPKVSHKKLVARAISKKKPFSESGKGYRDALIWESIKLVYPPPRIDEPGIVFVTTNYKDFGDESLHPDLIEDLDSANLNSSSLRVSPDLDTFNKEFVLPQLKRLDKLMAKIQNGRVNNIDFQDEIRKRVKSFLNDTEFNPEDIGLRSEFEGVSILDIAEEDINFTIDEVRRSATGEIFIEVLATVNVLVDFFINKADYYSLPDHISPSVYNYDWNEQYVAAEEDMELSVTLLLTVDSDFNTITSEEISLS